VNHRNLLRIMLVAVVLFTAAGCGSKPEATQAAPADETQAPTLVVVTAGPTETFEPFATDTPETPSTEAPTAVIESTGNPPAENPAAAGTQPVPGAGSTVATLTPLPAAAQPVSAAADKYRYVSQTLPDGYQVRPNVQVTISWTVKNIGTTAWTTDYSMRYFVGPKPKQTYIAFPKTISANTAIALSATFVTPAQPGDYDLWFKLVNAQSQNFGDVDFKFTVTNTPNNSAKPAATATQGS
jgi:hypothetical protein